MKSRADTDKTTVIDGTEKHLLKLAKGSTFFCIYAADLYRLWLTANYADFYPQ